AQPLRRLRLRPPRHAPPLPGVRGGPCGKGDRMKRIRRWMFRRLAVLSLAMALALVALRVRSGFADDFVGVDAVASRPDFGDVVEYRGGFFSAAGRLTWSRGRELKTQSETVASLVGAARIVVGKWPGAAEPVVVDAAPAGG